MRRLLTITGLLVTACGQTSPTPQDGGSADARPADGSTADAGASNPYLPRVANRSCVPPGRPGLGRYRSETAFPDLSFSRPIWVGIAPGDPGTVFVAEQGGRILAFDNRADASTSDVFVSLPVRTNGNEEGLLGLAFHPDYPQNGSFFVNYSSSQGCPSGFNRCSVISRIQRSAQRQADPNSERRLLVVGQPYPNHNGGALHFGRDGYLYISLGDGGSGNDPDNNGQDTGTVLGSILRIDVDTRAGATPYGIPADNPFAGGGGAPEIYLWGLRNVWRMSEDPQTGALWLGDVGQDTFEEIDKVTSPGNLGWRIREGLECRGGGSNCSDQGFVPPVHAYGHTMGRSVTGGVVYRGNDLPELDGSYLFADFVSGRVWSLREQTGQPPAVNELFQLSNPSSFGIDARGEVLITTFAGTVERLVRQGSAPAPIPAARLSDTGCFEDVASHRVAAGVLPYELNLPFWSDGLVKERFVALPDTRAATPSVTGPYDFPEGTVFVKTFRTTAGRRVETRLFARDQSGWSGHSYRWNGAQTDATLVDTTLTVDLATPQGTIRWTYPSSGQCNGCHTAVAGHVLGFRSSQLHRDISPNGTPIAQLTALQQAGVLAPAIAERDVVAFPSPSSNVPTATHTRALLDVNCAMCHAPGGPTPVSLDLRFDTPLAATGVCDVAPSEGSLGIPNARLVAPQEPDRSVLPARMNRRGPNQMPPLASNVVDDNAVQQVRTWIQGLTSCP